MVLLMSGSVIAMKSVGREGRVQFECGFREGVKS